MQILGVVEDTLFVPMLGRIYASEYCPQVLYDKKALELKNKLPSDLIEQKKQNQYTLLASASRSANMDRFVRSFLERRPDGVIVQLGCGLETTYHRCDNGKTHWYAVDLPHVIQYRRGLLGKVFRIEFIDDILQWNCKIHTFSERIEIICHSQESYMEKREYSFNIIAGFDIISAKSGQIFYNNTIDFSMLDIFHHLYESRTVKICT